MAKDGVTVSARSFPMAKHAQRVGIRPPHYRGDLARGADRQWANVLMVHWKGARPFCPEYSELPPRLLGTALPLDPVLRHHVSCPRCAEKPIRFVSAEPMISGKGSSASIRPKRIQNWIVRRSHRLTRNFKNDVALIDAERRARSDWCRLPQPRSLTPQVQASS